MSYYRMHRGWMDNRVFGHEEYNCRTAWIWLIENAAWEPKTVVIDRQAVRLERGELSFSEAYLAKAWRWSKSRVHRFLVDLATSEMISKREFSRTELEPATEPKCTPNLNRHRNIISICNYEKYQSAQPSDEPKLNRSAHRTRTRNRTEEERIKELKESKNHTPASPAAAGRRELEEEFEEIWTLFPRKRDKGHALKAFIAARKSTALDVIAAGVQQFARDSVGKDPQYIAYPATWINGKRWTDEQNPGECGFGDNNGGISERRKPKSPPPEIEGWKFLSESTH